MGRKNKYKTHVLPHLAEIPKWYETMTEGQIAEKLGVSSSSWENYKNAYPELVACLRQGKDILIDELKQTLRKKAKGYDHPEVRMVFEPDEYGEMQLVQKIVTTKHFAPDLGSIHLLLKNLDENWHNDDAVTIKMKEEQLQITKDKAEAGSWVSGDA